MADTCVIQANLFLANSAELGPAGLVSALGLGWSVTGTPTGPAALVILMKVPWDETNRAHAFLVKLVDEDGHDVMLGRDAQDNPAPLLIAGQLEVGRPPGLPPGTPIDQNVTLNIAAGMPLDPGRGYEWRMEINGEAAASAAFLVRPASPGMTPQPGV